MNQLFLILTGPFKGGTFLDWTIHYLSGNKQYYSLRQDQTIPIIDQPLTQHNAHNFITNQICTYTEFKNLWARANINKNNSKFSTVYFHHFRNDIESTRFAVNLATTEADKVIILENSCTNLLYDCKFEGRVLTKKFQSDERNTSWEDQHNDFIEYFFQDSLNYWKEQNLTNVWDYREFLALNIRPFASQKISNLATIGNNTFYTNCEEWFVHGNRLIIDIMQFLQIPIDQERFKQWVTVYNHWRDLHYDRLRFSLYFDTIVQAIIDGIYIDLTRFNLDIIREAAIQHVLLYQHNLNLKNWGLTKFTDTQQLNALLEPNQTHNLTMYNILEDRYGIKI